MSDKKTTTVHLSGETLTDIDDIRKSMIPVLSRSQFMEVACIEKIQKLRKVK